MAFAIAVPAKDLSFQRVVVIRCCGAGMCDSNHDAQTECPALAAYPKKYAIRTTFSILGEEDILFVSMHFTTLFYDFDSKGDFPNSLQARRHLRTEWQRLVDVNCQVAVEGVFYQRREEEGKEPRPPRFKIIRITPINPPVITKMTNRVHRQRENFAGNF